MINIWKKKDQKLVKTAILERNCWIEVSQPTSFEIETLESEYNVPREIIQDALDPDERPRFEKLDGMSCIIFRIPVYSKRSKVRYATIPLAVILTEEYIITVSMERTEMLEKLTGILSGKVIVEDKIKFLLYLMGRSVQTYLYYLKTINRYTSIIETELQQSIRNNELIKLLRIEKSLVYFTTSLRGNELLLEKLQKFIFRNLAEEDQELLDDLVNENKQAIEMTNIYSNILSGMMDAFASVISNNLNVIMKRLTMISIVLMIPTFFASVYGMNVPLPFMKSVWAFPGILIISLAASVLSAVIFSKSRIRFKRKTREKVSTAI